MENHLEQIHQAEQLRLAEMLSQGAERDSKPRTGSSDTAWQDYED